jgi:hypothetical protein
VIAVRSIKASGVLCVAVAVVGLFAGFMGATPAFAAKPWWYLSSDTGPAILQQGQTTDEVQEVRVSGTAGDAFELVAEGPPPNYRTIGRTSSLPFDATDEEVQAGLEGIFGAGNVVVSGGPGDEQGTKPYFLTFTGGLSDVLVDGGVINRLRTNGAAKEPVVVRTEGRSDGEILVTAANMGDADLSGAGTPVRIADELPPGLTAVSVEGVPGLTTGLRSEATPMECSVASARSADCTFAGVIAPYEQLQMIVHVDLNAGAKTGEVDESVVSGGNAAQVTAARPITVGAGATPFGVEEYEMAPEEEGGGVDTQAGSHPFQLTTTLLLNQNYKHTRPPGLAKDLNFKVPPGLIGNPTPFPQCRQSLFEATGEANFTNACPSDTAIGVAAVSFDLANAFGYTTIPVPLFNLEPSAGEPARFGFDAAGVRVYLDTSVRTGEDYGVTVSVENIPQEATFLGSRVTFWGVPGDPRHDSERGWDCVDDGLWAEGQPCVPLGQHVPPPLLELPTSCTGPLQTSVDADSWQEEGSFRSAGPAVALPALDGCNALSFTPSLSVAPDGEAGSTPSGLTVGIHLPQEVSLDGRGLGEADVKDTTVTLPAGVALNPSAADGLLSCSVSEIGLENDSEPSCPEASKVGTVRIKTPLLPNALEGAAYLAAQDANPFGSLVALYVVAQDPVSGTLVKLAGEVTLNEATGQIVSTFKNTPQLPFEDFEVHFFGGSRAPLGTPALCGDYTTTSSIEGWAGNSPSMPSSTFQVVSGPNGSPCHDPLAFAPSLTAGTTGIQAGGFSPFTMTMSREDGSQNLQAISLKMPPGLSGLLSSVKLCGEAQADAGTCGPESEIGETTVSVGLGGNPFSVKGGKVYITGPYDGAPFGLSIVNPAVAGPFNLGKVVVRAKIEVDPHTAELTITSDDTGPYKIPTILDGIPLEIQHVNVTIDRPGFTFNPTDCDPLKITGSLSSAEGATDALSVPFQVTDCAILGFAPKFAVSTSAKTSRADGASLSVKLTYPQAPFGSQANIGKVKVELPEQLPSRLSTLQKACTAATFEANPADCPSTSIVGHAKAVTPLLPVPLEGPAYFVSHGGEAFPSLIVVLQGDNVTLDLVGTTFISKAGVTSSTFKTVPDAPVGSFELTLPEGPYSALGTESNLCKSKLTMPTEFVAQNGAEIHESTKIAVTGCPKAKRTEKHKRHGKHGTRAKTRGKKKK